MKFPDIQKWTFTEVKEWLERPSTMEDRDIEFKSQLPSSRDTHGKQRLKETFCAFANTKGGGGLVLFGINNDKSIRGIPYDNEFKTKLGQIVNSGITPIINWDIINILLDVETGRYIYIVAIFESPYYNKPHVSNERVFIRYNGEKRAINDGVTLRKLLELEKFSSYCIESLEKEAEKMNTLKFVPQELDYMYLLQLRQYLEQKASINTEFKSLLDEFRNIIEFYFKIKNQKTTQSVITGENGSISENQDILKEINELSIATRNFINNYKKVHGL